MTLEMKDLPVAGPSRWPALHSTVTAARMSLKMDWKSTGEAIQIENPGRCFRFTGTRASCPMEAQIKVPSIGFSWKHRSAISRFSDQPVKGRYYGRSILRQIDDTSIR
jgi:hypothetical protein